MKFRMKAIIIACSLLLMAVCIAGCQKTPYQINDSENYNVSIKFDANGGSFTTSTTPTIVDSYNISQLTPDDNGQVQIPLLKPDDANRGKDAFTPVKNGYFLAGWYQVCEKTGEDTCTYAQPWDFDTDRVKVDPNGDYSSKEPVLTLYAAWVPMYQVKFYDRATGDALSTYEFSPLEVKEIQVPHWNEETGAMKMYEFPEKEGYTFESVWYDAAGTQKIEESTILHSAVLDPETATVENSVLELYVDFTEGNWYQIRTAKQFLEHYSPSGCYEILADLDFTGENWKGMTGNFSGTIHGNGHTFSNIQLTQNNDSKTTIGLFGSLTENATITDLHLQNVELTIQKGTRKAGSAFGLLAGSVSENVVLSGVTITDSALIVDANAYFGTEDYVIGLVCGMGETDIDDSGIRFENNSTYEISVTDDAETVAPAA